jgi:uncharacterized protein YprB with RNaseH-like and TPR domain
MHRNPPMAGTLDISYFFLQQEAISIDIIKMVRNFAPYRLTDCFKHTDLMYDCWQCGLKGGLKAVERTLGIDRKLKNVNGYVSVQLWWDYVNNNNGHALKTLLEYNKEDVVNLRFLRQRLSVT